MSRVRVPGVVELSERTSTDGAERRLKERSFLLRAMIVSALPLLFLLGTGFAAIDFGHHWDEELLLDQPRRALTDPITLLPARYNYPSVAFWLSLSALSPEVVRDTALRHSRPDSSSLISFTRTARYKLRVRGFFLVVTSMTVFAVAALALALGGGRAEALLASSMVAFSWEVAYHARWSAPDGPLMALAAFAVFAAVAALQSEGRTRSRWLAVAVVMTGAACGTKYSAWPLIIPLSVAAWHLPAEGTATRHRRVALCWAGAVAVYLLTTPGTLLQPTLFLRDLVSEVIHYSTGHNVHTVPRGAVHFWQMTVYLGTAVLSPSAPAAVALALFAVFGVRSLWKQSRTLAWVVLSMPLVYLVYFSTQRVMIVRNLLILVPFLAILSARGVAYAVGATRNRLGRVGLTAAVAAVLTFNAGFSAWAAQTIRRRDETRHLHDFSAWAAARPGGTVTVSARIGEQLAAAGLPSVPASAPERACYTAFLLSEAPSRQVEANRRGTFSPVFGPRDVNLDYYPTWAGDDRVLVMPTCR